MKKNIQSIPAGQDSVQKKIVRKTVSSFAIFLLLTAAAIFAWNWLMNLPPDHGMTGGIQEPLRKVLTFNETVFTKQYHPSRLAKTYPLSAAAKKVRVNGDLGLSEDFDTSAWRLQVVRATGDTLFLSLADIKKLPKTEIVFDFKCIEGWSQVTHWGGVKFSDFMAVYHLNSEASMNYIGMHTPDEEYYVGIDMASALHPQTLLCYEMNGKPLPMNQGYPLRMIIPVKYGIKSLKRIGTLFFAEQPPPDYWYERGYDYYSGL